MDKELREAARALKLQPDLLQGFIADATGLRLWRLERDEVDYDEFGAFVVMASTEEDARRLAHEKAHSTWRGQCEDGCADWLNNSTCVEVPWAEGIVAGEFHAG